MTRTIKAAMPTALQAITAVFLGTSGALAQDVKLVSDVIRSELSNASLLRSLEDDAAPQDYIAAARADYRRLLTALYADGYYSGVISITIDGVEAANIAPLAAPSSINQVVITVDPGEPFRFGTVEFAPLPPNTELPENLGPRRTARASRIKEATELAITSWREIGFAKAAVGGQSIVARHDANRLDVSVTLAPGPRLRFGELNVDGTRRVSDTRIRQIAGLPVGDVYSPDELATAERRLRRTGTFQSVALVESDTIVNGDILPINAQLTDAKLRRLGFGIELSTVEGLTVSSFWLHRNFLGGAERFRAEAEVSGIAGETGGVDYRIGGQFTRPATFGPDTDYFLNAEISRQDEPEFLLDKISIETGFSRIINDDLTVRAAVGVLRAREETEFETRTYTLLTLPLDATYDRRNNSTNATDGYYIDVNATPFISTDGDIAGGRFFGDVRGYFTPGEEERVTFAARGQIGNIIGAELDEAPADFLFYSGGGGTVRGQPYQSLGVETVEGGETVTSGGLSFLGAQLEARVPIGESLELVGFYDVGYVGATTSFTDEGDWHAGAGLGVRYNTPIGPIRLDIGTPASGDNAGESLQVYIGIGQAF